jgi:uncharacterized protein YuzE
MQVTYDPEVDILNLRLKDDKVVESEYLEDENVVIDYNFIFTFGWDFV